MWRDERTQRQADERAQRQADERAQRQASQVIDPSSRPQPPARFPVANVPGPSGGGFSDGRYITITYTQVQGQQPESGYRRPPVPPPSQFPVPQAYPTSGHASASGHFDYSTRPPAVPQVQSRVWEHPAHPPPYHHVGFVTTARGPPEISEPRPPYPPGPSGPPNQLPHAPERTRQQGPSPPNWPSTPQPRTQPQPQRRYDPDREYQAHRHAQLSQPYTPRVAQKKALVIGINYSTHPDRNFRLQWGVDDAYAIASFLQERCGFHGNNIRILTDDQHDKLPTKANILAAMHWLVNGAQPGDSLFFYFSGHATQVKDLNGDEPDGFDECLCTMEYMDMQLISCPTTPGIIVDDVIHDIMVRPLLPGCRLTAVLDCCHSGTLLDLPFIYDSHGRLKRWYPEVVQQKESKADVISLSACKDSENAWERGEGGALRRAFIEYMKTSGNRGSCFDVIRSLRAYMRANNFNQKPQLSSSHQININQRFII